MLLKGGILHGEDELWGSRFPKATEEEEE